MHEETLSDIRKRCRMAMNGVASTSMRQRGLPYKVNWGLSILQIKDLAKHYQPDVQLAEELWKSDTRELKLLATMLYPIACLSKQTADLWANEISNQELREQICINLFQNLSYAKDVAIEWGNSENEKLRTTGYWLVARLLLTKKANEVAPNLFKFIFLDVVSEDTFLRNAASLAIKHMGRQSKDIANNILEKLQSYRLADDLLKQEAYNSIAFEFEYFFEGK